MQVGRPEKCRSVSAGGTGSATINERHSYAEGRVPAPHGAPSSPGAAALQRNVAAACFASRRLLEETLAKSGKFIAFILLNMIKDEPGSQKYNTIVILGDLFS